MRRAEQAYQAINQRGDGNGITYAAMEDFCLEAFNEVYEIMKTLPDPNYRQLERGGRMLEEVTAAWQPLAAPADLGWIINSARIALAPSVHLCGQ